MEEGSHCTGSDFGTEGDECSLDDCNYSGSYYAHSCKVNEMDRHNIGTLEFPTNLVGTSTRHTVWHNLYTPKAGCTLDRPSHSCITYVG